MFTQPPPHYALGVTLTAVAVVVMAMSPAPATPRPAPDCTFTIDAPVPIGPEQASIVAKFSASIGDTLTATFPEEAKVEVVSARHGKHDAPLTATLLLSTLHATAGQWLVSVRGEKGTCTGKVWVGQGLKARK
jgi:hypothetical protein